MEVLELLIFCTVDGLQLIISKRNPKLIEDDKNNPFGFTVVRKIEPEGNYKSSRWVYLVIDGKIPSFERDYLDLMPGKHPDPYGVNLNMDHSSNFIIMIWVLALGAILN